jgi:hypothetical protein
LRSDGQVQTEPELAALEALSQPQHGQMDLFAAEDVRPWKSTRSVLPKKAPKSSSPS